MASGTRSSPAPTVRPRPGWATPSERITAVVAPYVDEAGVRRACLAYVYEGLPSKLGLLKGTRWQQLAQGDGATRYETVEIFSGPLVRLAGPGRVADGFRRHAEALKARAEALVS
jgi:hypothetical protein